MRALRRPLWVLLVLLALPSGAVAGALVATGATGHQVMAACAKAAQLRARVSHGRWSVAAPGLTAGTWHLVIRATDVSGNARRLAVTLALTATT